MLDEGAALRFQLDRFSDYLTLELGSSPRTLEAYRRDVVQFLSFLATHRGGAPYSKASSRCPNCWRRS